MQFRFAAFNSQNCAGHNQFLATIVPNGSLVARNSRRNCISQFLTRESLDNVEKCRAIVVGPDTEVTRPKEWRRIARDCRRIVANPFLESRSATTLSEMNRRAVRRNGDQNPRTIVG